MSVVKISGNTGGTGIFHLRAPNSSTDRFVTLPDKAGDIAVGAGTIVQVVQGSTSTQVGTTSNTLIDTGLSATITPTSSSNKIMVMVNQQGCYKDSNNTHGTIRLYRGTTFISMIDNRFGFTNNSSYINIGSVAGVVLDSPATTSATTYKTQFSSVSNQAWVYVQNGTPTSTMTLIEVVG